MSRTWARAVTGACSALVVAAATLVIGLWAAKWASRSIRSYFLAENELPWWPLNWFGTVRELIRAGFAAFWDEGPSGGHYRNLMGPYREIGCGIHEESGLVTVVVAFR